MNQATKRKRKSTRDLYRYPKEFLRHFFPEIKCVVLYTAVGPIQYEIKCDDPRFKDVHASTAKQCWEKAKLIFVESEISKIKKGELSEKYPEIFKNIK